MAKHKSLSTKTFPWILSASLGVLTMCSFAISYAALSAFAEMHQIAFPWLWPLIIDGTITLISIVALMQQLAGRDARGYFKLALVMTGVSVGANVVHMIEGENVWPLCTYVAHAIAPMMIAALTDVLLRQVAHSAQSEPRVTIERDAPGRTRTLTREQAVAAMSAHKSKRAAAKALGCAFGTLSKALK